MLKKTKVSNGIGCLPSTVIVSMNKLKRCALTRKYIFVMKRRTFLFWGQILTSLLSSFRHSFDVWKLFPSQIKAIITKNNSGIYGLSWKTCNYVLNSGGSQLIFYHTIWQNHSYWQIQNFKRLYTLKEKLL